VRRTRPVHFPAGAAPVELRGRVERHHQVDFAIRMHVTGTHAVHVDHVDTESMRRRARLDDSSVPDTAGLAVAHPARGDGVAAGVGHASKRIAVGRVAPIEIVLERLVE